MSTFEKIYNFQQKIVRKIGRTIAPVVLGVVYVAAVVPTGILMKLVCRDRLALKKSNTQTYWKNIDEEENYEFQF